MRSPSALSRDARKLAVGWRWRLGYLLGTPVPSHYEGRLKETIKAVRRDTLTTAPRIAALCDSVSYIVDAEIEGALVECGVWRGGSMMAAALTLLDHGRADRDLYLFDTFTGMPEPGAEDVASPYDGYSPHKRWRRQASVGREWAGVPVDEVRSRLERTGYPAERFHLIPGMVEDTIPAEAPEKIALLRLDTDWYASTKHELEQLYPRLVAGGVLIIDDYGHYEGARRAVDEYFRETGQPVLLNRIDFSGRLLVKPGEPERTGERT
jgi:O-methyltransferase